MMNTLYTAMLAAANPSEVPGLLRFFKTGPGEYAEGDQFLGIKSGPMRAIVRQYQADCTWEQLEEWIASPYHEVRCAVLNVLVMWYDKRKTERQQIVDFYLAHTAYYNNWDLVDTSCYFILGKWLIDKDRTILYDMAHEDNLWRQRIAIVSTMMFVRGGEFEDTLRLCEILINHKHDLIHKATGWLLREVGKRDERVLTDWLEIHYHHMPRTMLRYAIERLNAEQKKHFMAK